MDGLVMVKVIGIIGIGIIIPGPHTPVDPVPI